MCIRSAAQIAGWKKVTEPVHQEGGTIFCQLWHVGCVLHNELQPGRQPPVAADNVRVFIETSPGAGILTAPSAPRELTTAELKDIRTLSNRR
ncbi:flavin oxidoreductase / NADH oxidase family protein [Candidatus Erwinia dacicola]|uniref:Flavin oxidoreductase / NADH oxidase family protein n=1 Tax=Candidatus Erwinia dacicola TaxID=252393 RepID=A0A328TLH2_9GAMM|nr:flavin oxidoreductase / NADH oxidase family protein [Candidatus Erwinia dacicola]